METEKSNKPKQLRCRSLPSLNTVNWTALASVQLSSVGNVETRSITKNVSQALLLQDSELIPYSCVSYELWSKINGLYPCVEPWVQFLRELKVQITDESEMETKEDMSELMASSQFDFNFSYGGNSISAEEMLVRSCLNCVSLVSFTWD